MSELRPVIIIGAARSGTKVLRDSLAVAAGAGRVPYDVGYVWRYGNENCRHDCLEPDDVKPKTRTFARKFLASYATSDGLVVEKTVGNTLRVPFVQSILPEARFVYLERDGVDAAVSARREWVAPTDWRYLAQKARHFPGRFIPSYAPKFIKANTLDRIRTEGHVGTWGPRYPGIDDDVRAEELLRVCARQWRWCVMSAQQGLASCGGDAARVSYAEFVASPEAVLGGLLEELGLPVIPERLEGAVSMVDAKAATPSRPSITPDEREILVDELGKTLAECGYDQP